VLVDQFAQLNIGGPDTIRNGCFPLCDADTDCTTPAVCVKNVYGLDVCATPGCRSDADCSADPCGKCLSGVIGGHVDGAWSDPSNSYCGYSGACDASSCAGCSAGAYDGGLGAWHTCFARALDAGP